MHRLSRGLILNLGGQSEGYGTSRKSGMEKQSCTNTCEDQRVEIDSGKLRNGGRVRCPGIRVNHIVGGAWTVGSWTYTSTDASCYIRYHKQQ